MRRANITRANFIQSIETAIERARDLTAQEQANLRSVAHTANVALRADWYDPEAECGCPATLAGLVPVKDGQVTMSLSEPVTSFGFQFDVVSAPFLDSPTDTTRFGPMLLTVINPEDAESEASPADKLVAALRSGLYKQGQGALRTKDDDFCCLGVACDIYAKETGKMVWRRQSPTHYAMGDYNATLPDEVRHFFGFESGTAAFQDGTSASSLMRMNDTGQSFAAIADKIESRPKGLFV